MTDTPHWTELREFEHCKPSALAFRAIVALLDTWPGDDRTAALEYADKLLSTWPDAVRVAPWSWCKAASKGAVQPTWRLVRALQLKTQHLSKGTVNLARLAHYANLEHITDLEVPYYSDFQELSFLYHRPQAFPTLKNLRASDKHKDGDVRALADSPLWRTLESFEVDYLADSLVHKDASRIVPQFERTNRIQHLTLRAADLMAAWDATELPELRSASIFIRSISEARELAGRAELGRLKSLSIAFRCGFSGKSPFEPFLGNIIEADEAAADAFFSGARLDRLEELAIIGYPMGYWGREGMGELGLDALIASGLLQRLKRLRLQLLPLGDKGVAALAPALGKQLEALELADIYCKGDGAAKLIESPCMSSLLRLDLSGNRIDTDHFVLMAKVDIPHLESLDLSGPPINPYYWNVGQQPLLDAGAIAWANSSNVKQLKCLRLQNCHLTDGALTAVFQSPHLRKLEELDLSDNSFTATAIAQAVVGSPLWQTVQELGLNNCRLDNAAIEALARVKHAPVLRSLQLGYNSIGPKGAAALANWPVLSRVWRLELHDNVIGDEGLIALARSANLGRLVELDFEQDCWNSRTFTFSDEAARALADSRSLPRLDGLFSGCVDEYHGAAYSPGFTKDGLNAVRKSAWMRLACKATCSDFSGIGQYFESAPFDEDAELSDRDCRRRPFNLNDKEAEPGKRGMQQVPYQSVADRPVQGEKPPEICPVLPELKVDDDDNVIEGLEFRDPIPTTDVSVSLRLSLEDSDRPLPNQVGKLLADTIGSVFRVTSLGNFESSGASSRQDDEGRRIDTEITFSVGFKGDPQKALQLMREALWWVGAPAATELKEFPLDLTNKPASTVSRFLQLTAPKVGRWKFQDESGYRIDREPFSTAQREGVQRILAEADSVETAAGWMETATGDGGRIAFCVKYLKGSPSFDTLNILVHVLTPKISCLIHELMRECGLFLFPMVFVASKSAAESLDCDWPKVEVIPSAEKLHEILWRGPYHWWTTVK